MVRVIQIDHPRRTELDIQPATSNTIERPGKVYLVRDVWHDGVLHTCQYSPHLGVWIDCPEGVRFDQIEPFDQKSTRTHDDEKAWARERQRRSRRDRKARLDDIRNQQRKMARAKALLLSPQ